MVKWLLIIYIIYNINNSVYAGEIFHRFKKTYTVMNSNRTISVGLILVDIPKYRELNPYEMIYNQVLSHSKASPFGDSDGRSTNVHETVHSINNELRNTYKKELKKNINGLYAGDGRGIIIDNPNLTIRDVIPYIPDIVKGYRYKLYFVNQLGHWNDVPTYPMDEWVSYIAGAECAVNDKSYNISIAKSDYVSGSLEFSIYCTALGMAVAEKDTHFWKNNEQFRNSMQYFLIKAEKVFFEGQNMFPSEEQNKLLNHLRNHDDTKKMREFLLSEFQGVFVD